MTKESKNRFAKSESMLAKVLEEKPAVIVETVAERYARELDEKKKKNVRVALTVPFEVKEEMDEMARTGEIKNINHFINYLIRDYLDNRNVNREE